MAQNAINWVFLKYRLEILITYQNLELAQFFSSKIRIIFASNSISLRSQDHMHVLTSDESPSMNFWAISGYVPHMFHIHYMINEEMLYLMIYTTLLSWPVFWKTPNCQFEHFLVRHLDKMSPNISSVNWWKCFSCNSYKLQS